MSPLMPPLLPPPFACSSSQDILNRISAALVGGQTKGLFSGVGSSSSTLQSEQVGMYARGRPPARWAGWAEACMCARGGPWPGRWAGLRPACVPGGGLRPGGQAGLRWACVPEGGPGQVGGRG